MRKTKTMSIRDIEDTSIPYVDDDNNIVGTINPLKLFLCKHGLDGDDGITDAVSGIYGDYSGTSLPTSGDLIVPTGGNRFALVNSKTDNSVTNVTASLAAGPQDDILIVSAAQLNTPIHSVNLILGIHDNTADFSIINSRATTNASLSPGYFTDSTPTIVATASDTKAIVDGKDYVMATAADRSGNLQAIRNDGDISSVIDVNASMATAVNSLPYDGAPFLNCLAKFYAFGYFVFPSGTLPSNWKAQVNWMAWNWARGNYVFPANWRNK